MQSNGYKKYEHNLLRRYGFLDVGSDLQLRSQGILRIPQLVPAAALHNMILSGLAKQIEKAAEKITTEF